MPPPRRRLSGGGSGQSGGRGSVAEEMATVIMETSTCSFSSTQRDLQTVHRDLPSDTTWLISKFTMAVACLTAAADNYQLAPQSFGDFAQVCSGDGGGGGGREHQRMNTILIMPMKTNSLWPRAPER